MTTETIASPRATTASRTTTRPLTRNLPLAVPAIVMVVLGLWGLDRGSLIETEAATTWAAHLPWDTFWRFLSHVDAVHGVYYLLTRFVFLFGSGEVLLRLPSVIGMAAAAGLLTYLAYRLTSSRRFAVVAGLVFVSLPIVDDWAQIGRSYAIDTALTLVMTCFFVIGLQRARSGAGVRWPWVGYAISIVVAGYLHEMTVLAVAAHAVTMLWTRAPKRVWMRFAVSVAIGVVALVPIVLISHAESVALSWIHFALGADTIALGVNLLGTTAAAVALVGVLVIVGAVPWARHPVPVRRSSPVSVVSLALPLFVLPGALLLIESAVATPLFGGARYVLYSTAGVALLAAAGIDRVASITAEWVSRRASRFRMPSRRRVAWLTVAAVLVALVFTAGLPTQLSQRTAQGQLQDLGGASRLVGAGARPGDAVLFIPGSPRYAQKAYPGDFANVADIAEAQSSDQTASLYGTPKATSTIVNEMRQRDRIWVLGSMVAKRGMTSRLTAERTVLMDQFHRVSEHKFAGIDVYLYVNDQA